MFSYLDVYTNFVMTPMFYVIWQMARMAKDVWSSLPSLRSGVKVGHWRAEDVKEHVVVKLSRSLELFLQNLKKLNFLYGKVN
jgi:hypothetical protein